MSGVKQLRYLSFVKITFSSVHRSGGTMVVNHRDTDRGCVLHNYCKHHKNGMVRSGFKPEAQQVLFPHFFNFLL